MNILRPKTLKEMSGCDSLKETINVMLMSSKMRNDSFPHTIIYGGPGLGKTTLANIIANEMGGSFKYYLSNAFKSRDDVQGLMSQLDGEGYDDQGKIVSEIKPTIIFLDEIHQLGLRTQESFFEAMEDFKFTITKEDPHSGEAIKQLYWVPRFTLIGATTRPGELDKPFMDRFKLSLTLVPYSEEQLGEIITKALDSLEVPHEMDAVVEIARRSKGVARKAVNYCERVRDVFYCSDEPILTKHIVEETFRLIDVDPVGLERIERELLMYLYKIHPQKIGVNRLSNIMGVTDTLITDVAEPFLLKNDFIQATPGGRMITEKGLAYCERTKMVEAKHNRFRAIITPPTPTRLPNA